MGFFSREEKRSLNENSLLNIYLMIKRDFSRFRYSLSIPMKRPLQLEFFKRNSYHSISVLGIKTSQRKKDE